MNFKRRSYVKKTKKRINRKNFRSNRVKKETIKKTIKDCIYDTSIIPEDILKNKGGEHVYEDRVSRYIDPKNKFVLLGLFDGHSGKSSSVYLSDGLLLFIAKKLKTQPISPKLLDNAFREFDYIKLRNLVSGSTATVIYVSKSQAIIANVGDSPAYSLKNSTSNSSSCRINQLSTEHDYFNLKERNRVFQVSNKSNVWQDQRVHGIIQASRGMGDFEIKNLEKGVFISKPSITIINKNRLKTIKYLMITSDGITDPFTEKYESHNVRNGYPIINDKQMLRNSLRNFRSVICENGKLKSPSEIIKAIVNKAIYLVNGEYQDDISIILLDVKEAMKYLK